MDFDRSFGAVIGIFTMIVIVAIIAVLVSKQANTTGVIGAIGSAFGGAIQAATAPVGSGSMGNPGTYGAANPFG